MRRRKGWSVALAGTVGAGVLVAALESVASPGGRVDITYAMVEPSDTDESRALDAGLREEATATPVVAPGAVTAAVAVQARAASRSRSTLLTPYWTQGRAAARSLTMDAGVSSMNVAPGDGNAAATSASGRSAVKVTVRAVDNASRLFVDVDPNRSSDYWPFRVQRRRSNGTWYTLPTTYRTRGTAETRTLYLNKGAYRVRVNAAYGYTGATSATVRLRQMGIRPTPARASKDLTQAHLDGCMMTFKDVVSRDCRYAKVGAGKKYVLLGDSHAIQWFPAAEQASRRAGAELIVFGKAACVPIGVDLWAYTLRRAYRECGRWQVDTMARMAALPRGTVVLLSGWHAHYLAVDKKGHRLSGGASRAALSAGLARTVAALRARGFVVVVIRDTPRPPDGNPAQCVAAHLSRPYLCNFARPRASAGGSWEQRSLTTAKVPGDVLDLNGLICRQKTCPAVEDGILRWRDTNHLTNTFAASLGPTFSSRLQTMIARTGAG